MLKIVEHDDRLSLDYGGSQLGARKRDLTILTHLLKGRLDSDNERIEFYAEDQYRTILLLQKTLQRLGIDEQVESDTAISDTIAKAQDEEASFKLFSQKAHDIREDIHDADDYGRFVASLDGLHRTLKPFQLLAAYHMTYAQNAGNFSVPGAGKTTTVLVAYNYLKRLDHDDPKHVDKIVVISPLSAFKAWKDEYVACFGRPAQYLEVFGGAEHTKPQLKAKLLASGSPYELIMVGYQSVSSYEEELTDLLRNNHVMVVLDEAHRIKRVEDGLWSQVVLRLAPAARARIVLTGTPAPNGYIDLRNLFTFMWPDKNLIGYSNAQLKQMVDLPSEDARIADLVERIAPFFIRVNKAHLELREAIFNEPLVVTMGPVQRRIYAAIENAYLPSLGQQRSADVGLFKSKLIRLRQAASNPALLTRSLKDYYASQDLDGSVATYTLIDDLGVSDDAMRLIEHYADHEVPAKFIALEQLLTRIIDNDGKAIVWLEFVSNILDVGHYLRQNGIEVEYLYGAVTKDERERIIDDFHDPSSKYKVLLANPHAVGESISLHKACHNAVYFEMSYNAAAYMQSKDRIHRVGLPEGVDTNYYFLLSSDSIDTTIHSRVFEKERKMLELIEGQDIPLLTNNADFMDDNSDDLKALLKDYYARHGLV